MDDSFESDGFLFKLPAYVIGISDAKTQGFLRTEGKAGEIGIVIFTDHAAAEEFIEKNFPAPKPGDEYKVKKIPDVLSLIGLLVVLQKQDCTHVNIDGSRKRSHNRAIGRIVGDACRVYDRPE